MPESAQNGAAENDLAAQRNEQVAQGHEWAAHAEPNTTGDLHDDAATKHRRTAGEDRSKAQSARDKAGEQTN
ncbi:hypothetical protein A5652_21700 [Mycobacterium sp. 1165178.9]|nr:hypothetical protein A5652_21700 [Mycobacterium sp. 1165178.9]